VKRHEDIEELNSEELGIHSPSPLKKSKCEVYIAFKIIFFYLLLVK